VEHRRRYTRRSLSEAFSRANFQVEQCFYQDSLGFFVTLGFKFIGNREGRLNGPLLLIYDRFVFPVSRLCDAICSRFFGKNVVIYARKPGL
jgi:hypothetical protein